MQEWVSDFVGRLAAVRLPAVFNPYSDLCEVHDLPDGPAIRRGNLAGRMTSCGERGVDSIWFGRDLGHRGGRRTGLALTDEYAMLDGRNGADALVASKATRGSVMVERTAAVIWSVARRLERPPFLWNAFPLHPHEDGRDLSNRAHTLAERRETAWTIEILIHRFGNPRLIAVGNDADRALTDLGFKHDRVRHPSYGGQREFVEVMEQLHGLESSKAVDETPKLLI